MATLFVAGLTSCDTGSRGDPNAAAGPGAGVGSCGEEDLAPFFVGETPLQACAGEIIDLPVANALPGNGVESITVVFSETLNGEIEFNGIVVDAVDGGDDPIFGCPLTIVSVVVPSGIRDGAFEVLVERPSGAVASTGARTIQGCPEILGYFVGNVPGMPSIPPGVSVNFDIISTPAQPIQTMLTVYGYNLELTTTATVLDGTTQQFNFTTAAPPAGLMLPEGVDATLVDIAPGGPSSGNYMFPPGSSLNYVSMRVGTDIFGQPVESNEIIIPFVDFFGGMVDSDTPGTISGAFVQPGVHRGDVEINFNLFASPSGLEYELIPEFLDPDSGMWLPCTPTADSQVEFFTGSTGAGSENGIVLGGGRAGTFVWDSAADVTGSDPVAVPVRLPILTPTISGPQPPPPSFTIAGTHFELGNVVLFNSVNGFGDLVGREGAIFESFDSDSNEDEAFGTNFGQARWDFQNSNVLSAASNPVSLFGVGTANLVLESGITYTLDTDVGSIRFLDPIQGTDLDLFTDVEMVSNPGGLAGEFHAQSLEIQDQAILTIIGSNPVVFRLSGTGNPDDIVAELGDFELDLSGGDAADGDATTPGAGGIAGGQDGGVGANIAAAGGVVTSLEQAEAGANGGGQPGESQAFDAGMSPFSMLTGAGGGGGAGTAGAAGLIGAIPSTNISSSTRISESGAGGIAKSDGGNGLVIIPGSGGGGGGAGSPTSGNPPSTEALDGAGGGGSGGSFAVFADGSMRLGCQITSDGGEGGDRENSDIETGAGGGGSGGSLMFISSARVLTTTTLELSAQGGAGGVAGQSGNFNNPTAFTRSRGGAGGDGIVIVRGGTGVALPSNFDDAGAMPSIDGAAEDIAFGQNEGLDATIAGSGTANIILDQLPFPGPNGEETYVFDTDLGTLTAPGGGLVATSNGGTTGSYEFASLTIEEDVIVRATGSFPLVIRVAGNVLVDGEVDISGEDGGLPDVVAMTGGAGGAGGPGGGTGGAGGAPGVDGSASDLSYFMGSPLAPFVDMPGLPMPGGGVIPTPTIEAATGGTAQTDAMDATLTAGGGGGGGYSSDGDPMSPFTPAGSLSSGIGGSGYGSPFFTFVDPNDPNASPELLQLGGMGGAGGAGNASTLREASGTGGGGGGGFLQISAAGNIDVSTTARLIARGGDAFRAPDGGGNGGGGAGGSFFFQSATFVNFEPELLDVRAGSANVSPTGDPYNPLAISAIQNGFAGRPGRVRVESPLGFVEAGASALPENALVLAGLPAAGRVISVARSTTYRLASEDGARVPATGVNFSAANVNLVPSASAGQVIVLYYGAPEMKDNPGSPGEFVGPVTDPNNLPDNTQFLQLEFYLLSDPGGSLEVDSFRLPYNY